MKINISIFNAFEIATECVHVVRTDFSRLMFIENNQYVINNTRGHVLIVFVFDTVVLSTYIKYLLKKSLYCLVYVFDF